MSAIVSDNSAVEGERYLLRMTPSRYQLVLTICESNRGIRHAFAN